MFRSGFIVTPGFLKIKNDFFDVRIVRLVYLFQSMNI